MLIDPAIQAIDDEVCREVDSGDAYEDSFARTYLSTYRIIRFQLNRGIDPAMVRGECESWLEEGCGIADPYGEERWHATVRRAIEDAFSGDPPRHLI